MRCTVDGDVVLSRPLEGPLSTHVGAFAAWLREQGDALRSRSQKVLLVAGFSRWLGKKAISVRRVCAEHLTRYLRSRARRVKIHQIHRGDAAALRQFLEFLRRGGIIPAERCSPCRRTPVEQETRAFETYLRNERALAQPTIAYYVRFIRGFLKDRFGNGCAALSRLSAGDVVGFVQRQVPRMHRNCARLLTTALRSFLNYARYRGEITSDLAAAVPCVAHWSMTSIARGKGGQGAALPLSAEVGAAIAAYLRHGRPPSTSRRVFLRVKAPIRGFLGPEAIASLVGHTLTRAGIKTPSKG